MEEEGDVKEDGLDGNVAEDVTDHDCGAGVLAEEVEWHDGGGGALFGSDEEDGEEEGGDEGGDDDGVRPGEDISAGVEGENKDCCTESLCR